MSEVVINTKLFQARLEKLYDYWNESKANEASAFNKLNCFLALMGSADEDNPYQKTAALHTWLLGYEFPATLMLFTPDKLLVFTSSNKAKFLEPLQKTSSKTIEVMLRTKDDESNKAHLATILDVIKSEGRLGVFLKDSYKGKAVDEWNKAFETISNDVEKVDLGSAIAPCMSIKDPDELQNIVSASAASSTALSSYFVDQMSTIVDEERKVTHLALAERVERVLENQKFLAKIKTGSSFDPDSLEWCYTPIIQSGGQYDLKPSALSDEENIHGGVILCSLGLRYKSYCSNIGRTYLIDPTGPQTQYYEFLLSLQKAAISKIRDGVVVKDLYEELLQIVRSTHPELEAHFPKNIGNGIGIDFRDTSMILNSKNTRKLATNMTLNLSLGFQDLENSKAKSSKSKIYSLLLIDTVKVQADGAVLLTSAPKSKTDISYFFNDDSKDKSKSRQEKAKSDVILSTKTRGVAKPVSETNEQRRREHQKELATKLQEQGLKRFPDGSNATSGAAPVVAKKFESYRREGQLPPAIRDLKIVVDARNQTVVFPIYGRPVPLHINTIKSVSKNDEGDFVYLRINLVTPGQVIGKKDDTPFEEPDANFIRSLTFRSADVDRITEITKQIQEMKKDATKKEAERREMADVVDQDNLIEVKNRRPQKLLDVYVRPGLDGKRVTGELEIQQNGLRYQSPVRSDHRIDILFSNIRHLFFQPCDNELMVIIHVNLKNPILVGKKKARDVQFYREASDVQFDETANRKRKYKYGDEDELEAEQDERRRRAQLNKEFKAFSEKIAEAVSWSLVSL